MSISKTERAEEPEMDAKPTAVKITPAQRLALTKLADGAGSNQMRQSTRTALHGLGLMAQGRITPTGLKAIGR